MNNSRKRPRESTEEAKNSENNITSTKTNENELPNPTPAMAERGSDSVNDDIVVRGLRLEAIFHPKFDNERKKKGAGNKGSGNTKDGSGDIRSTMLQKLGIHPNVEPTEGHKGTGHLEVSLKHSGSLVLWSGSTRYYSKNSACNEFTRTAEILFRQRFEAVRQAMLSSTGVTDDDQTGQPYRSYEDCSRFVSHNRYTVAFEVCAAEMLGDHGQVPNIDYVVVTAVADRANERFLSTTEVLEFCHRFRLPHNDVWTFFPPPATTGTGKGLSSAERLFRIYDDSLRESGYTANTVQGLTEIADVYIPSPIPHSVFQGSICEGFIVRYVEDASGDETAREQLEGLAQVARDILKEVPPPASAEGGQTCKTTGDSVLDTDLRALFRSISSNRNDENGNSQQQQTSALQRQRATMFSECLKKLLEGRNEGDNIKVITNEENISSGDERQLKRPRPRTKRQDLHKIEKEEKNNCEDGTNSANQSISLSSYHLPTLTNNLTDSRDIETSRIATLLQTLDGLKGGAIRYAWMEKHDESLDSPTTRPQQKRLYCTIHVCNDSTFFKFQSLQSPSEMTLFRGFCVEVLLSSSEDIDRDQIDWGDEEKEEHQDKSVACSTVENELLWRPKSRPTMATSVEESTGAPLMLKMKLLPYMVRTFVCRNLLKTIQQKGPEEFERIALGLLDKWKMSSHAQDRWMPFFRGWSLYVLQCKTEFESKEPQIRDASSDGVMLGLGNLTNFSYLRHLEHFTKLYESGKFRTVASTDVLSSPEFHTFVCFVSQSTEVSMALAKHFAKVFNMEENSDESKMKVCSLGEATKKHISKSCIAYANVGDVTKGIKKFICDKKIVRRSIFVLFGSNKDEIIALTSSPSEGAAPPSWMDISSASEGKKLVGMWKPWKKFPCARRIELGRSFMQLEPKMADSITAEISCLGDAKDIIDAIKEVGTSLLEQETKKQSNSDGGILVFFPGIPGCGKSSLVESSRLRVEEEMGLRVKEKGDVFDRNLHIKEGDKIGKNFWNIIEDLLSLDNIMDGKSPAIVIADKNAPPASWQKLGQISNETNGIMLPALPDSTVLETTTIEGSILPNGTLLPQASHFYPFSLKFLSVALARVLNRPAGEHSGKLDSGFPMACMVVVQFFSFYRYIGADTFQEKLSDKFDKDGAFSIKMLDPVKIPFLKATAQGEALPDDLKEILVEALQLRHGHDKSKKFKVKKDDLQMIDMEKRTRSCIEAHRDKIAAMTVSLEDTVEAFTTQIMERIGSSCSKTDNAARQTLIDQSQDDHLSNTVKLVSIDIDRVEIQRLLQKYRESGTAKNFFDSVQSFSPPLGDRTKMEDGDTTMSDVNEGSDGSIGVEVKDPNFVDSTHITMAFAGETNSPETLISKFYHLQGREVTLSVTGILWSSTNAALAIKIASSTSCDDSYPVPTCENAFPHITVWVAPDVKKSLSNKLPDLVESGKAFRVEFEKEDTLVGKVSFWNHKNEPFRVQDPYVGLMEKRNTP